MQYSTTADSAFYQQENRDLGFWGKEAARRLIDRSLDRSIDRPRPPSPHHARLVLLCAAGAARLHAPELERAVRTGRHHLRRRQKLDVRDGLIVPAHRRQRAAREAKVKDVDVVICAAGRHDVARWRRQKRERERGRKKQTDTNLSIYPSTLDSSPPASGEYFTLQTFALRSNVLTDALCRMSKSLSCPSSLPVQRLCAVAGLKSTDQTRRSCSS